MRFDAHQDHSTDVGIRDFGRHAGRGAFEQQAALALTAIVRRPRGALATANLHQGRPLHAKKTSWPNTHESFFSSIRFHQFAQIRFSAAG